MMTIDVDYIPCTACSMTGMGTWDGSVCCMCRGRGDLGAVKFWSCDDCGGSGEYHGEEVCPRCDNRYDMSKDGEKTYRVYDSYTGITLEAGLSAEAAMKSIQALARAYVEQQEVE